MTRVRSVALAIAYFVLFVAVALAGGWATNALIVMANDHDWGRWSDFGVAVLNFAPSFVLAFIVFNGVAALVLRAGAPQALQAHFIRAAGLYLFALAAGVVIAISWSDSDFGLWGQAMLWPFSAVVGGILGDTVQAVLHRGKKDAGGPAEYSA